ncbi:MAG: OsmC family protein [Promethearchaeota archaeon]
MSKELIEKFTNDPSLAEKNLMVRTVKGKGFRAVAEMGDFKFQTDSPAGLGGEDDGPSPLLVILGVCGQCFIAVTQFWSLKLGVQIDSMEVFTRGKIDLRNLLGMNDGVVGFESISIRTRVKGPDPEKIQELLKQVESHTPILDLILGQNCKVELNHKIKAS